MPARSPVRRSTQARYAKLKGLYGADDPRTLKAHREWDDSIVDEVIASVSSLPATKRRKIGRLLLNGATETTNS